MVKLSGRAKGRSSRPSARHTGVTMRSIVRTGILIAAGALAFAAQPSPMFSRPHTTQTQAAAATPAVAPPQLHDGQHDFDFNLGTWKTHIRKLQNPLTGSSDWVELNGTVRFVKVLDGPAQFETIVADGPGIHFEGMQLYLYNPESHQWSMTFARSHDGVPGTPSIGEFKDGRMELYDQEVFRGRTILVRCVYFDITPDAHRFEQSFSEDGGKTWEPNFVAALSRVKS